MEVVSIAFITLM